MSNDPNDRTEDALRRALSVEAQQVLPGGDGLTKIQQRVAARGARWRWMRPALAGSVAVAVIAAGVGGYAIAHHGGGAATVKVAHSTPPTPNDVAAGDFPSAAFFPFTDVSQEKSWEQEYAQGSQPWIADPEATATFWVQNYLKQSVNLRVGNKSPSGTAEDVTFSRKINNAEHPVTVVHLVKFHNAWLVTGASDAAGDLAFISPTPGASVTSPLTVTGPGYGVDEQAEIEVRDATTPDLFGKAQTGPFGNGTAQWSATVPITPTSDTGVVVATVASPADGGVGALAAEKVVFGESSAHTADATSFYGVQGGKVTRFNAVTGASEGVVSGSDGEGTAVEVRQFGDSLYFTARTSDCLYLYSLPAAGGTPTKVTTADPDYGVVGFDVSKEGRLVYLESSGCNQSRAGSGKLVFAAFGHGPGTRTIDFPSEPPAPMGDPVWEADGIHVDMFVRTGMEGYLARYDSTAGDNPQPNTNACPDYDINAGLPDAITMSSDGTLWFAAETGSATEIWSCGASKPTKRFTIPATSATSIAINEAGAALVTDGNNKIWKWDGSGDAAQLTGAPAVSSVAW